MANQTFNQKGYLKNLFLGKEEEESIIGKTRRSEKSLSN